MDKPAAHHLQCTPKQWYSEGTFLSIQMFCSLITLTVHVSILCIIIIQYTLASSGLLVQSLNKSCHMVV